MSQSEMLQPAMATDGPLGRGKSRPEKRSWRNITTLAERKARETLFAVAATRSPSPMEAQEASAQAAPTAKSEPLLWKPTALAAASVSASDRRLMRSCGSANPATSATPSTCAMRSSSSEGSARSRASAIAAPNSAMIDEKTSRLGR
jgi:hypothetical protein